MNANEIVKALRWLAKETEFIFAAEQLNDAADIIESLQKELAESKRREREAVDMIGQWPVTIGSTFCGARIIGADYRSKTIELDWRGPQDKEEG